MRDHFLILSNSAQDSGGLVRSTTPPSRIGFPRESTPGDRRTLLTPVVARLLVDAGYTVLAERGLGLGIGCHDHALAAEGVQFASASQVWSAPLVLRYKSTDSDELQRLTPGQSIGALFHAEGDPVLLQALTTSWVTAYSYEFLQDNGRFPLAGAGGTIAGIQAVHLGGQALQSPAGRGVLLGNVPGAEPAKVLIIGSGNVGSAAARTAAALGASVTVLTRTESAATAYRACAPQGVHVAVNSPDLVVQLLSKADLVIGAILISTFETPPMITEAHLASMKPGAVIVDATCGYGPGYLPTAGPMQTPGTPPHTVGGICRPWCRAPPATPTPPLQRPTCCASPAMRWTK
jgi:alanine dehydrogenase